MKYIIFTVIFSCISTANAEITNKENTRALAQQYYQELQTIKRAQYIAKQRIELAKQIAECRKYGIDCRVEGINSLFIKQAKVVPIKPRRIIHPLPSLVSIVNNSVNLLTKQGIQKHQKIGSIINGFEIIKIKATYIIVKDTYTQELQQIDLIWNNTQNTDNQLSNKFK